jgi:hypothetical protein
MFRRSMLFVCLLAVPVLAAADVIRGAWHMTPSLADRVHLEMSRKNNHNGNSMRVGDFRGLNAVNMKAAGEVPAQFQLVRDAGTFDFNGTFNDGDGVGRFTFTPDAGYAGKLRSIGVAVDSDLTDERLFSLALHDVSTDFIGDMRALGYNESLSKYIAFRIHGATPEYVRAMQALGFSNISSDRLLAFRIHGVTPDYVREMKEAGFDATDADRLVSFRIHGVTPAFARDMRDMGVTGLSPDKLVAMRIHGVTSSFVRELGELGYRNLSSEQLVRMRIHGVTTSFIRELSDAGYKAIPVEKLVQMKIRGVDSDFLKKVQ